MPLNPIKLTQNLTNDELTSLISLLIKGMSAERLIDCLFVLDELGISDPKGLRKAWLGYENRLHPDKIIALDMLAANETIESVAHNLGVSEKTIDRWIRDISDSIGSGSKHRALEIAREKGLGIKD